MGLSNISFLLILAGSAITNSKYYFEIVEGLENVEGLEIGSVDEQAEVSSC